MAWTLGLVVADQPGDGGGRMHQTRFSNCNVQGGYLGTRFALSNKRSVTPTRQTLGNRTVASAAGRDRQTWRDQRLGVSLFLVLANQKQEVICRRCFNGKRRSVARSMI